MLVPPMTRHGAQPELEFSSSWARTVSLPSLLRLLAAHEGDVEDYWSSLIGIATAIIGNVLISFALNLQRYAHIRITRERALEVVEAARRDAAGTVDGVGVASNQGFSYGTQHGAADGLATDPTTPSPSRPAFPTARGSGSGRGDGQMSRESDPLISAANGRDSRYVDEEDDTTTDGSRTVTPNPGSHREKGSPPERQSYLRSPYWWAGIILMTIGEAGNFLAYGFAPASIVSPLGVVSLVSNCLIAPILLKEPFRGRDLFGVAIAVAGAVTVVFSASDNNPKYGPDTIWRLIGTWEFETYLAITVVLIVILIALSGKYGHKSILIDLGVVALCGGYTALSTKGVASLLSYKVFRMLTFPLTYLLVAVLVGTAVLQIKYINRALQRFDATEVIPTQFVLFTLSVIIGSAILYRDFERTSTSDSYVFVGGCALTFAGVWLITSKRDRGSDEESMDEEALEQAFTDSNDEHTIRLVDGEHPAGYEPESPVAGPHFSPLASPITPAERSHRPSISQKGPSPLITNPWISTPSSPAAPSTPRSARPAATPYPNRPGPADHTGTPNNLGTISAPILPSEADAVHTSDPTDPATPAAAAHDDSPLALARHASWSAEPGRVRSAHNEHGFSPISPVRNRPHTGWGRTATSPSSPSSPSSPQTPSSLIPGLTIVPNPLTAPLSGSLSAVVADSLRRGFRDRTNASPRTPRGRLGQGRLAELFTTPSPTGGDDAREERVDGSRQRSRGEEGPVEESPRRLSTVFNEWLGSGERRRGSRGGGHDAPAQAEDDR